MMFSSFWSSLGIVRKQVLYAVVALLVAAVAVVMLGDVAHGSVEDPTNESEARARVAKYCGTSNQFTQKVKGEDRESYYPAGFGAYVSDYDFDDSNGSIVYDLTLFWRGCTDAPEYSGAYAYAVTGYPASSSSGGLAICPNVGQYGQFTGTHDCVKYTAPSYPTNGIARLACSPLGIQDDCTTDAFYCAPVGSVGYRSDCIPNPKGASASGGKSVGVKSHRPGGGTTQKLVIQGLTGQIPDWDEKTLTSGTHRFGRANGLCSYWHIIKPEYLDLYGSCQDIFINVSWERYGYTLQPAVNTIPTVIEQADSNLPVSGAIYNQSSSTTNSHSNIRWNLTRTIFAPGATVNTNGVDGGSPCSNPRVSGGSCTSLKSGSTGSATVARSTPYTSGISNNSQNQDWTAGTRVCFQLSISRYGSQGSQTGWRHSELRCAVVGKKPKVQVHGGSLQVGRAFNGAGLSDSRVEGSITTTQSPTRIYGSWVEYGIFATGDIENFASGSGLSGGSAQQSQGRWSCLSFANAATITSSRPACESSGPYGGYIMQNAGLPDVVSQYPVTVATPRLSSVNLNTVTKNRVVSASGSTLSMTGGQLDRGEWLVVNAAGRTVNIVGNLRYDDGPLQSARDIPQLIIIAHDINIRGDVSRVDAWLIATGSLVTCSDRGGASSLRAATNPANLPMSLRLSTDHCDRQLTVNGPVVADTVWLRRTHGSSGSGAGADEPAEIFNLRPDAYLWVESRKEAGVFRTTSLSERPPRY